MGKLYIKTALREGKTVLEDCFFTAPFKVAKPFYSGDFAEIMIMQASAGILEGDSHEIKIEIGKGSKAVITGQSYTKLFKCKSFCSSQSVYINIEENAFLKYLPCPVIPFKDSDFRTLTKINLKKTSCLVLRDIFSCGRTGMGENFLFKKYQAQTLISEEGVPVFCDNTRLVPSEINLEGTGFFEGYTHMGLAYFYGFNKIRLDETKGFEAALTEAKKGRVLRALAYSGEDIINYTDKIIYNE